ncbi:hypothetical protein PENTCL1PPCAC_13601, partial [Pristionchus entomophagus]
HSLLTPFPLCFRQIDRMMESIMNIFSLPVAFLHSLMRKMTLKDRLKLRLICHHFEKLVANTHAGHFGNGTIDYIRGSKGSEWSYRAHEQSKFDQYHGQITYVIHQIDEISFFKREKDGKFYCKQVYNERGDYYVTRQNTLSIRFGDETLYCFPAMETQSKQFRHLIHRLFRRILLRKLDIKVDDSTRALEIDHKITKKLEINHLHVRLPSTSQLPKAPKLISEFPNSKHSMFIEELGDGQALLSIPSMETLSICRGDPNKGIPAESFISLLGTHKNISFGWHTMYGINEKELLAIVKVISEDNRREYNFE